MTVTRLTPFPNLYSSAIPPKILDDDGTAYPVRFPRLPDEILILAWAFLLRSYTEEDELAFAFDDRHLVIDAISEDIVECKTDLKAGKTSTGIYHGKLQNTIKNVASRHGMHLDYSVPAAALSVLNPEPSKVPGPQLLHNLINHGAEARAGAIAVQYLSADGHIYSISYETLHRRSVHLASVIRHHLGPMKEQQALNEVVPVLLPQSTDLYVSLLAILRAGAAFCPLNLDAPVERVRFIAQDVEAKVLLTSSDLKNKIELDHSVTVLLIDELPDQESDLYVRSPTTEPDRSCSDLTPDHWAYVIYTSGSTGTPKGVPISHSAVCQTLLAHDQQIPQFLRFLQFAAPTFDVSVFEIFFPWLRGATLAACDRTTLLTDLPAVMNRLQVDAAELTPTVAGNLLQHRNAVPTLRLLLTIGEMLTVQVIQEFGGNAGDKGILYGMYGPSECTIHCTMQPGFLSSSKVGIIGTPLSTVSTYIMKPQDPASNVMCEPAVVPVGQIGELIIGGHQLAQGYLNRESQTTTAFLRSDRYGPLYRTGDKARLLPDGSVECLGRIAAGQVKLRGQRVELGEIEETAGKTAGCRSAVAVVVSGMLVLFCAASDAALSGKSVLETCRQWLPSFMSPGDVVILDQFPCLPSGKVNKKALEQDYIKRRELAPQTENTVMSNTMRALADTTQEILRAHFDQHANLRAAGMDSIQAIRLSSRLRRKGFHISPIDVLEAETLSNLETCIELRSAAQSQTDDIDQRSDLAFRTMYETVFNDPALQAQQCDVADCWPCTPVQKAMLAETALNPQAYCNWVEFKFSSNIPVSKIKSSFEMLAKHHSSLRSGFYPLSGAQHTYAQIVWTSLTASQVVEVLQLDRSFSIVDEAELSRPLRLQICGDEQPRALLHLHHALYDGWSQDVLLHEWNAVLKDHVPTNVASFRSVAQYYTGVSGSLAAATERDYWIDYLQDVQPAQMPNFNGRDIDMSPLQHCSRKLSIDYNDLQLHARNVGCSPSVYFQAAFAYILSGYLGTDDVVFGLVASGRTLPITDIESIIGPCLVTLPCRTNISASQTIHELLQNVDGRNREMLKHTVTPMAEIKQLCEVLPGRALFDSLFVWQETSYTAEPALDHGRTDTVPKTENSPELGEAPLVTIVDSADFLEFAFVLELEPCGNFVQAKVNYQAGLIPSVQIDLFLSQYDHLMNSFLQSPDCETNRISRGLPMSLLSIENPYPKINMEHRPSLDLVAMLEEAAQAHAEDLAIEFASSISCSTCIVQRLTYRELHSRANALAYRLQSEDVEPGAMIAIFMTKSPLLYIAILASIKVGAAYLPLAADAPAIRVQSALSESGIKLCLIDDTTSSTMREIKKSTTILNIASVNLNLPHGSALTAQCHGEDLAYAILSSGTTGRPKTILVTRENLRSHLDILRSVYPSFENARMLQACSQAFDVSVFEIFFTWVTGACLCSAQNDVLFEDIEESIRQLRITHLSLTPTVASLVHPENVPNVRFLVTAGEAVTEQVHREWAGRGLYQGYGPAECTNICSVLPNVAATHLLNNIGPPLHSTSAFVIAPTDEFRILPRGFAGELCFGGSQIFRGYQNMAELNARKLIEHSDFGKVFRSGDLGRLLPDGSMAFLRRSADDQIKIRGQRVELGEISHCIMTNPQVFDCVTLVMDSQRDNQRFLVSFWVPLQHRRVAFRLVTPDESVEQINMALFEHVSTFLPTYMVPQYLVPIAMLPRTHQGKIDKRKLTTSLCALDDSAKESYSRGHETQSVEDPVFWSSTELNVSKALAASLGLHIDTVGRNTSFFSLGLDSISAISFAKAIKAAAKTNVAVSTILKHPTVARCALAIDQQRDISPTLQGSKPTTTTEAVFSNEFTSRMRGEMKACGVIIEQILPCTPLQEAMLSATMSASASGYYNKTLYHVHGDLDRLLECWRTMCKRHTILRTCFVPTEHPRYAFAQLVLAENTAPHWEHVNVEESELSTRILQEMEGPPPDLTSREPPVYLTSINSKNLKYIVVCMHHALYDAMAMATLATEMERAYRGETLPQTVDFSSFLQEIISLDTSKADAFWQSHLDGFRSIHWPRTRYAQGNDQEASLEGRSSIKQHALMQLSELESSCRHQRVSLLALCQAAWTKTIAQHHQTSDVCFGNVVSGRTVPVEGVERLVAPTFNTLPVRVNLMSARKNADITKVLHNYNTDVLPFQLTSLRRIRQFHSRNDRESSLFDSILLLQQLPTGLDPAIWSLADETGEMNVSMPHSSGHVLLKSVPDGAWQLLIGTKFPIILELIPSPSDDTLYLHIDFDW
ncbi:hypothetical protein LTR66_007530 [Elasticomyces elasticus]|nr:hypothetical protein LTR66_007530 [Elasticomyces elasticus]